MVNYRSLAYKDEDKKEVFLKIAREFPGVKAFFIDADRSEIMLEDEILDEYDLIFKREPFKDLDKYNISDHNKKKIRPTMLSCHLVRTFRVKLPFLRPVWKSMDKVKIRYQHDVFFSGKESNANDLRRQVWQKVKQEKLDSVGGLLERHRPIPADLKGDKMSFGNFLRTVKTSKVNLAMDGIGQFTFRHLEIWALGGFMLAGPALQETWLPISAQEGVHYASFSNPDDAIKKIKYYLENEEEREKIAKAGKEMFEREYDVKKHGRYIGRCLSEFAG